MVSPSSAAFAAAAGGRAAVRPTPAADFLDQTVEFRVARQHRALQQLALTGQCVFELTSELEPFLPRSGSEIAERADRLLARSLGGLHRRDEDMIGVGLVFVVAGRAADIHSPLRITKSYVCQ